MEKDDFKEKEGKKLFFLPFRGTVVMLPGGQGHDGFSSWQLQYSSGENSECLCVCVKGGRGDVRGVWGQKPHVR